MDVFDFHKFILDVQKGNIGKFGAPSHGIGSSHMQVRGIEAKASMWCMDFVRIPLGLSHQLL